MTDIIHAYDTIIRHEIGHVMDAYHQYYGFLLSKASDDAMERFVYSKLEVASVANKLGGELDRCLYINKYAPAEAAANEYGGVSIITVTESLSGMAVIIDISITDKL